MALGATYLQTDVLSNRSEISKILEDKMEKAKHELSKLKDSYDNAYEDIQNHYMNASAALTSIKEMAEKAVDAYMVEYQNRLKEELEKMEELKKELKPVLDNNSMNCTRNDGNVLSSALEIHVGTVPNIRFLGNEAFLYRVVNSKPLPYFGCITIDNKVFATDFHLQRAINSETQEYTFRIDVPKNASDCKDLNSRIKIEVFQKETGTSINLPPVWVTDHFEVKFGFMKKTPFSVAVYLLDQHIFGSPMEIDPEEDLLMKETYDDHIMEVVKTPVKRRIGTPDPVIEAALKEINNNMSPNNNIMKTSNTNSVIADGVFKISKRTKIPCNPPKNSFLKPDGSLKERLGTRVDSGASSNSLTTQGRLGTQEGKTAGPTSFYQQIANIMMDREGVCRHQPNDADDSDGGVLPKVLERLTKDHPKKFKDSSNDTTVNMKDLTVTSTKENEDELKQEKKLNGTPVNYMVRTMSFNSVEAHLQYSTSITSPYSLNRPVGVLEHSSGVIFVSDTFNDRVLCLDEEGGPIGFVGPTMSFRRPSSMVELNNGFVAVICSNFIAMFDEEGNYLKVLGKELLQRPYGLCLSEDGKLMTVETVYLGTLIIVTLCPERGYELSRVRVPLGLSPPRLEQSKPRFIACYKDKLFVGDLGLDCVYEVNYTTGRLLSAFGNTGTSPGSMIDPSGIACDQDGNIYVADSRNHRIQVFDLFNEFICIIDTDFPLNRPSGIFLAADDHLLVLNYWDNTLAKYKLKFRYV